MKCVILQPSYIPWRGYFHQIHKADVFVFYDDVQYDQRGWRNRNRIKSPHGPQWLTVPVAAKGARSGRLPIHHIPIAWDHPWNKKHLETLRRVYTRAPHFERYKDLLDDFYSRQPRSLVDFTIELTIALSGRLGITGTTFLRSSTLPARGSKTDRLISILGHLGATHYISGPSARAYLDEEKFRSAGIGLEYMEYRYPEYPQLYPPFDPQVSILDLMFMVGPEAPDYIWGRRVDD